MQWKKLDFAEYEISENGELRSLCGNPKLLKGYIDRAGYQKYKLTTNGKTRGYSAHQLVALCFIGEPPADKTHINHKDGNKLNNSPANLEWISHSENFKHYVEILSPKRKAERAYKIIDLLREKKSQKDIAKMLDVSVKTVWNTLHWYWFERNPKIKRTRGVDF